MTNRYEKRFLFSYFLIKSVFRFANFIQSFETFDKIVTVLLELCNAVLSAPSLFHNLEKNLSMYCATEKFVKKIRT